MSRASLDKLVGTKVVRVYFCCVKGVEMADGGRCLGLMQAGRLRAWLQPLYIVSHEARKEAFCLSRC